MANPTSARFRTPIQRIVRPFQEFAALEASGGILLLTSTLVALVWANSPWGSTYAVVWHTQFSVSLGGLNLSKDLLHWINEGLMVVFFFVVGLEIKREVLAGELATRQKAVLPIAAAAGGMVIPAVIYSLINAGGSGSAGWGIPMATDIAFALGVLALLGNRVPLGLKIYLTALAIVDDIGAVLVVALFYTTDIAWLSLAIAAGFLAALVAANRAGVRHVLAYTLLGIGLWFAVLQSGIHPTLAGILLAMTIPSRSRINADEFLGRSRDILHEFAQATANPESVLVNEEQQSALLALETACEHVETPLQSIEHALHPWVTFVIIPVFALANAGVALGGNLASIALQPVTWGVITGLVVGKPVGIYLFTWLAVKGRLAVLPTGVSWNHICGAGILAGIGFTMSLFIASLAFGDGTLLAGAKLGALIASLIAGITGGILLRRSAA